MKVLASKKQALELYESLAACKPVKMYTTFTNGSCGEMEGTLTGKTFSVTGIATPLEESYIIRTIKPHIAVDNWGNYAVWVTPLKPKFAEADIEYRSVPVKTAAERCEAVLLGNKQVILNLPYNEDLRRTISLLVIPPTEEYKEITI